MPKAPRKRPDVVVTSTLPDGSQHVEVQTWEQQFGKMPRGAQAMVEHGHLNNTFFQKESDRAVAVLAPAWLDTLLKDSPSMARARAARTSSAMVGRSTRSRRTSTHATRSD